MQLRLGAQHLAFSHGCILVPDLFSDCIDWSCGTLISETRIAEPDFAAVAVILAEPLDVSRSTLLLLSKEEELLGFGVSGVKAKILSFLDI